MNFKEWDKLTDSYMEKFFKDFESLNQQKKGGAVKRTAKKK